jgi:5-methylcytosine-specific restriction endonuclease McrA
MKKWNYAKQLLTKKWKTKRDKIKKRDGGKCTKCGNKNNLEVHHKKYTYGKKAWEYPDSNLITLCSICHYAEHQEENDNKLVAAMGRYRKDSEFKERVDNIMKLTDLKNLTK